MKIIWADRVPVGLSYGASFNWHMPICRKICRGEQKYMPFFGTVTERDFRKKIQSTETYTNDATLRSGFFFPENTFDDGPAFWIFSHDSRIRVDDIPIKYF